MDLEDYIKTLSRFGFTVNQAKVYVAIVELGFASVGPISRNSGVRREEVYRILPKLEQMGLIERVLGTPNKIKAIPLEDAFSILVKQRQDEINKQVSELAARAKDFLSHFKLSYAMIVPEKDGAQFSLIIGKAAISSRISTIIGKTKREIDVIASVENISRSMFIYAGPIHEAIKRGVKFRMITAISDYLWRPSQ
jgi:sugar-specific transcriptional regulator TrmB